MPTREFLQQKVSLLFCTYLCHFLLGSRKVFLLQSWQLDIEWVYSYNSYCIPLIKYKPLWITCALDQSESTFQVWEAPRGFDKLLREFSQTVKYWVYYIQAVHKLQKPFYFLYFYGCNNVSFFRVWHFCQVPQLMNLISCYVISL